MQVALNSEGGYPLFTGPEDGPPDGTDSPFSVATMRKYLESCHYHYSLDERPTKFTQFELREKFFFRIREFWVWSCTDGFDRIWDVTIGRGETPVQGQSEKQRWMHAVLYTKRYTPRAFILSGYPEHADEVGKAN